MIQSDELNIRHLYAAAAIARLSSISRAAEAIHISQPALTHAMGKLEAQLGHKIFDRRTHGVEATPQGRIFLAHVQDGLTRLAMAAQQLRQSARLKPLAAPELHITNTQLRALLAVLGAGSYSAAAKALGFSQPSIYRAIRELQAFLGLPLFSASDRVLRAPDAVIQFGAQVRLALASVQSGIDELAALDEPGTGRIRVGSLPLARSALLPELLGRFSNNFPKVAITVAEGQYAELIAGLRDGRIDFMFGALRAKFDLSDLAQHPLFTDELCVVGRVGHPLTQSVPHTASLGVYPWIVAASHSPMRGIWARFMQQTGGPMPARQIECSSILLARELLLKGDWLALMSPYQFRLEEECGILARLDVKVPGSIRPIGITLRQNWRPTAVQQAFLHMAEELARQLPGTPLRQMPDDEPRAGASAPL